jgi:hypothetical protein
MALERGDFDNGDLDIDLLAASLRADASDLHAFMEVIATKLETTLPGGVQIERARDGFRGPKLVRKIAVEVGGDRLELRRSGAAIEALRAKTSGGIVLKTERLGIDDWLGVLARMLGVEAQRSQQTRQALGRLLDT